MRIAVVSDTHGDKKALSRALKAAGVVDAVVHLGDNGQDLAGLAEAGEHYAVCGNCDPLKSLPEERLLSLCGHTVFLCHGHRYGVKGGLQRLYYRGLELEADIVLFGHTHQALCLQEEKLLMLNPGSAGRPYPGERASIAVLELEPGMRRAQIITL